MPTNRPSQDAPDLAEVFLRADELQEREGTPLTHSIIAEAERLISADRNTSYGDAREDFARQAAMWSVILGMEVGARQVAMCMIATKLCRETHAHKRDNPRDMIGYAALLEYVSGDE